MRKCYKLSTSDDSCLRNYTKVIVIGNEKENKMKKPRVYIASKMSGIPAFNFPAFDAMRVRLTNMGFDVVSPADIDREHGFDGTEWLIEHP